MISLSAKGQRMIVVQHNLDTLDRTCPHGSSVLGDKFEVTVLNEPLRDHIDVPVNEQQIVELYSK